MRLLVIGANGFIGNSVAKRLADDNDVYKGTRNDDEFQENSHDIPLDLTDKQSIIDALKRVQPDAIVNCAGIVENNEKAELNPRMTQNLLEAIVDSAIPVKRVVVLGSAAEYGIVDPEEEPVKEHNPPRATSPYGVSKVNEASVVDTYRDAHDIPVVTARIFNPIGTGMPQRQLLPRLIEQVREVKAGDRDSIEVSRLDSQRDYIDVKDVAEAIDLLVTREPKEAVYNIGSGVSTTNQTLVDAILKYSGLQGSVEVTQTSPDKEPYFASRADISRLQNEFGWKPTNTIDDVVKEIVND